MKVLGVVCSPRKAGNTEILMEEALESAAQSGSEVELWTVVGKDMKPCDGCRKCHAAGICRIEDDLQQLYVRLVGADGIIFGTPTYVWNVTAQAKMIIDRCHALRYPHLQLRDKAAAVLITQTRAGGTACFQAFSACFNSHRMTNCGAALGFSRDRGEIRNDTRAMAEARSIGRVVVRQIVRNQRIDREAAIEQHMVLPEKRLSISTSNAD